jgi:hypothetical protein
VQGSIDVPDVSITGGTITGKAFSTRYYIYYDDTTLAVTAPTFVATTDSATAQVGAAAGRHFIGYVDTPADGAAGTGGTRRRASWRRRRRWRWGLHPMIERTFDAAWFNGICNLPEVRPGLGGEGEIDVSALILNPANYALKTEHGGFILIAHGAGVYSVHSQFSAEGRGKFAVRAMRAGLEYMFTRTDCMRIFSHCPDSNPATLGLARAGWAHQWFRREIEPQLGPGMTVSWDVFDWPNNDLSLEEDGRLFTP